MSNKLALVVGRVADGNTKQTVDSHAVRSLDIVHTILKNMGASRYNLIDATNRFQRMVEDSRNIATEDGFEEAFHRTGEFLAREQEVDEWERAIESEAREASAPRDDAIGYAQFAGQTLGDVGEMSVSVTGLENCDVEVRT